MTEVAITPTKYIYLDVENYTKDRTVEAQVDIITKLNEIVSEAVDFFKLPEEKLIFIPTGDGICIALLDVKEPLDIHIQIAKKILGGIHNHNKSKVDKQRKFQVRIGINENVDNKVIDINKKVNVAGQGINMSQRIMSCGDGGQILVGGAVHEILRSREDYVNSFKPFTTTAKHDLQINLYQYIKKGTPGLNITTPSRFVQIVQSNQKVEPKLSEYQAYYFMYAIKNQEYLYAIKDDDMLSTSSVILLHFLADDAVQKEASGNFGTPRFRTWGYGKKSFEEQCAHYKEGDIYSLLELESLIWKTNFSNVSLCFEKEDNYFRSKVFINEKGKTKLLNEYPSIYKDLGL